MTCVVIREIVRFRVLGQQRSTFLKLSSNDERLRLGRLVDRQACQKSPVQLEGWRPVRRALFDLWKLEANVANRLEGDLPFGHPDHILGTYDGIGEALSLARIVERRYQRELPSFPGQPELGYTHSHTKRSETRGPQVDPVWLLLYVRGIER